MSVGRDQERALAYVLRLWRVTDGELSVWRASLQDIRTGERRGFAGLDGACRYLRARIALTSGGSPGRDTPQEGVPHDGSHSR
jgi:hypothetical protein